ncbi:MAG: PQQ-dependent sugar dehydrogenase [Mycobacteriaceae bacterium]
MSAVAAAAAPNAFLNNQTPTLAYDPAENQVVDGHIKGNLRPVDPDSTKLTYTATKPALGTVAIDPSGTFDYTPGVNFAGQDMFDVTVSDAGSGFHIHGVAGLLNLLSFGLLGTSGHKKTETVLIGDQRTVIASGLNSPVDFRFLPDGRIVVGEKGGAIKVIATDGTVLAQPLITLSVNTLGERGISGLAVDPQFTTNGHIYVAYTTSDVKDRLSQFTVSGDTAAPGSEKILLETTDTVATNHHGGGLAFGPDGKLYWGKGDNGTGSNAQNLTNIYGKILRINPDGSTPSDNPVLPAGALPQIYAYGLRNPFRLTFTPTGQLLVADVGNAAFEELNRVTAGGNYGWPGAEGICTSNCTGLINPIYTYARGSGAAFSSVLAYDPAKVFIADEVQGWLKVLTCNVTYTSCGDPQDFDLGAGTTVALAKGPGSDGGLYQLTYQPGTLVRIALTSSV